MSKLITNFGDSNTTGNTTLQQNLAVQGAFSTFSGNILAGSVSSTFGNSTNKFNTVFATTANIPSVNVTGIFGTTGFIGINTTGGGAILNVAGNVWASNALSAPSIFATVSMNALTANTANIFGPLGVVGISTSPVGAGANLQVGGNVWSSNALSAPLVLATVSMNVTGTTNTSAIFGTSGSVGIGTNAGTTGGATLNVAGNAFISNALVAPNVFALTSMNTPTTNTLSFYGPSGFVGVGTSGSGSTLNVAGNVWVSNALSTPNIFATVSMNVTGVTNTASIFGTSGSVGIGTNAGTTGGATLNVAGNVWVSNALSAPTVFATVSMNVTGVTNTAAIFGTSGSVGIGLDAGTTGGATLNVAGNVYASNALSAPNVFALTSMNVAGVTNTAAIFGTSGSVGIGTNSGTTGGATLNVAGNVWVSNALVTRNIFATTANITTLNVSSLTGTSGTVGIGTVATGPDFYVAGNLYASNAVTAPNCIVTTMNISSILNTQSIFSSTGRIGINTSTPGANLHVHGNVYASNALTAPVVLATTSMNITTLNTTSIFGTSGSVGIGTTLPSAAIQVQGNMYATNAISTTNIIATTLNTTVINTASIFGTSGFVGVGAAPLGSTLDVTGNLYASNALTSPNIISGASNITILNTTSIYSTSASVGINTTATGATLMVGGNLYASNALTGPNLFATGTIYYGEDLVKRAPYLVANVANSTIIQSWISATCNAADQSASFWAMSGTPAFGNVASGPAGGGAYRGSVLLPDGRVLFVPYNASNVGFFNPSTGLFSTVVPRGAGIPVSGTSYQSGVLLRSGNVAFVPFSSGNVAIFNPLSYELSNAINKTTTLLGWNGCLDPLGNLVFTVGTGTGQNVLTCDTVLKTISNLSLGGTSQFSGTVPLPNGNLVFVYTSGILNYNPFTGTSALDSTHAGTSYRSSSATLAPNGNIVAFPDSFSTSANVIVTSTTPGTAKDTNIFSTAVGSLFAGAVLLPSGNILAVPYNSANIGMVDPVALTFSNSTPVGGSGLGLFSGGTLLPDGRVVLCPYNSLNVGVINTMVPVAPEFCLSPYFNKY